MQYWGTDKGGPDKRIPDYYFNNAEYDTWQWVYFGDEASDWVFYILHHQQDQLTDTFSYLGNSEDGVISPDGMVVFGFGRDKGAETLFLDAGQKFTIGFAKGKISDAEDHDRFSEKMRDLIGD